MGESSAPPLPRPQLVIKLGQRPTVTATSSPFVAENSSDDPPTLAPAPTNNHTPNTQGPVAMPPDAVPRNLRLEHAQAALAKKRKPMSDDKVPSSSNKKQKISPGAFAIPPDGNSIKWVSFHGYFCCTDDSHRGICMQHWNQGQPGGQGLATDFEVYYKNLSEAEKQVRPHSYILSI